MNSRRRSLLAPTALIDGESPAHFAALLQQLSDEFQPLPGNETTLVESMAVSRWRQLRLWGMESTILSHEIRNHRGATDKPLSDLTHAVYAARNLTDHSHLLDYLAQEQSRCELRYATAHKRLLESRSRRATVFHVIEPGVPPDSLETQNTPDSKRTRDEPAITRDEPKPCL